MQYFDSYRVYIKYWAMLLLTVLLFGTLLGSVGIERLKRTPALSLIDHQEKVQITNHLQRLDDRVDTLDKPVTALEHRTITALTNPTH